MRGTMRRVLLGTAAAFSVALAAACGGGTQDPAADGGSGGPDGGGGGDGAAPFFLDTSNNFAEPAVAVDGVGGVHVVYRAFTPEAGRASVRYAYCPADCDTPSSWSAVGLGGEGEVERPAIVLTAGGRPRVAWHRYRSGDRGTWHYAECDAGCTEPSGWRSIALADTYGGPASPRYLALDADENPSLVIDDDGPVLLRCDGGCTRPGSWRTVPILTGRTYDTQLAWGPAGGGHLAFWMDHPDYGKALVYLQCTGGCDDGARWSGPALYQLGSGYEIVLRLDPQGRPRLALYSGFLDDPSYADTLFYAWCDGDCGRDAGWSSTWVGLPEYYGEEGLDLAFDAAGRPRIAYRAAMLDYGVGLAWCDAGCGAAAGWTAGFLEEDESMSAQNPVPVEDGCSISLWSVGAEVALALDPAGRPRLVYEAIHHQAGTCWAHDDLRLVRAAMPEAP